MLALDGTLVGGGRERPLGNVVLLRREVLERVSLPPLVHLVVLVDIAGLGTSHAVK